MLDWLFKASEVTAMVKTSTTTRMENRNSLSLFHGRISLITFSVKVTAGDSKVALAQLLIADSNAPKNMTCANTGIFSMISVGNTSCESVSSKRDTIAGSISVAEYARKIGMNTNMK